MYRLSLFFFTLFLFFSCRSSLGFGVVVWQDTEDSIEEGQIVNVYGSSQASKMYIVGVEDRLEKIEVPMYKVLFAKSALEAQELKEKLEALKNIYAISLNDGLPIREAPDNTSKQIYRLRAEQMMKLLWKEFGAPVITASKKIEGDWYRVITDDGVEGYCFSHNLELFDSKIDRREKTVSDTGILSTTENEDVEEDEKLKAVLSARWYPEYYRKMINNRTVDLTRISTSYGFFPGDETKTAKVILPNVQRTFQYSDIKKVRDKYRFGGSPLSLYIRYEDVITVEFTDENGRRLYENFITLNTQIENVIEKEKARRFEEMKKIAGSYVSENYGELEIGGDGFFYWREYNAIVPLVIPENADNGGEVSIKYFLSRAIKKGSEYEGVLSFQFSLLPDSIDFIYKVDKNGIMMEPILKECIEEGVVTTRIKALTLYFARKAE